MNNLTHCRSALDRLNCDLQSTNRALQSLQNTIELDEKELVEQEAKGEEEHAETAAQLMAMKKTACAQLAQLVNDKTQMENTVRLLQGEISQLLTILQKDVRPIQAEILAMKELQLRNGQAQLAQVVNNMKKCQKEERSVDQLMKANDANKCLKMNNKQELLRTESKRQTWLRARLEALVDLQKLRVTTRANLEMISLQIVHRDNLKKIEKTKENSLIALDNHFA